MAAACGLWDVGRMWFLFVLFKKTGFCTIEARILGQDRLTYCAAFSNLGVGVSIIDGLTHEINGRMSVYASFLRDHTPHLRVSRQ